ncbi:Outer membrane salicin receptor, partial [Novosphingobium sp. Rr 2-17]|uniref:TonB-dependent receptor n=1 Tax=Novosphingobium sp. Rr 2-17 TaxID=555793 RepID=UPI0002699EE4
AVHPNNHTGGYTYRDVQTTDPDIIAFQDSPVGTGTVKSRQYWAEAHWNMGWATLTYLPALRTWHQDSNAIFTGFTSGTQTKQTPKDNFWTQELRLASNSGSKLIWQTGALYYKNDLRTFNSNTFSNGAHAYISDTTKHTTAFGIFGEMTYPFTDNLRLTAGLRYDVTKVQVAQDYTSNIALATNPSGLPEDLVTASLPADLGTQKFHNWTYKIRLENDLTPSNMVYGSVATSFSPGDVSLTTCAPTNAPCPVVLAAETLTAFEIGTKNRFLSNRLQVNGAVYYYDYGGYQTAGINVSPNPLNPVFQTLSVPVKSYGFEMDAVYQITGADRLMLNFAYTHARYVDKSALFAQFVANDTISTAVPFTANATYEHVFTFAGGSNLRFRADGRYLSPRNITDVTQQQVDVGADKYAHMGSEFIGNVNATWTSADDRFSVTGYVRNITDNRYFVARTITTTGFSGPVPSDQWTFATQALSDPRTYGFVVGVRF